MLLVLCYEARTLYPISWCAMHHVTRRSFSEILCSTAMLRIWNTDCGKCTKSNIYRQSRTMESFPQKRTFLLFSSILITSLPQKWRKIHVMGVIVCYEYLCKVVTEALFIKWKLFKSSFVVSNARDRKV